MKVSVVIPTYKPQEYLSECIQSLVEQSFDKTLFEVIVVLNGEKEGYLEYIKSLVINFENFKVFYIEDKGVSYARNYGISLAKGEFITFIDDDDLVSSCFIEFLYNKACVMNSESFVQSNFKTIKNKVVGTDYISEAFDSLSNKEFSLNRFRKLMSSVCGKMFPAVLLKERCFNTRLEISEDAVFLFELSKDIDKISIVDNIECIYFRRIRDNSATTKKYNKIFYFKCFFKKIKSFSSIYLSNCIEYNFFFYLTRILASFKVLFNQIVNR